MTSRRTSAAGPPGPVSTTWDERAVPTITADSDVGACFGLGHAQAVAHAHDVLEAYGIARGRAARSWGPEFTAADVEHARLGLDEHVQEWTAAQDPTTQERLQAFCGGFNTACAENPELGRGRREVLPVRPRDVIAHVLKTFLGFARFWDDGLAFARPPGGLLGGGSNAWAVGARASTTGRAALLSNPHLPWGGAYRMVEARTVSPGRSCHGATPLGFPWQTFGYTPHLAWTQTVNPLPQLWVYELDVEERGYLHGGRRLPFTEVEHSVQVRGQDPVAVLERRTVHGPVLTAPDGASVAVRIAGVLHAPATACLATWWRMSLATSVRELVAITDEFPLPMFNVVAADDSGSVAAVFCGSTPQRPGGDFADHRRRRSGDDPGQLWRRVNPQSELPRTIDPGCGWVQNVNENPWWFCEPPLDPAGHPDGIAPRPEHLRDIRSSVSRERLRTLARIAPADLLALKWDTRVRLADVVLEDLVRAAAGQTDLAEAVAVLQDWDRTAAAESSGYPLFHLWSHEHLPLAAQVMDGSHLTSSPTPGDLPTGLVDPVGAVEGLRRAVATLCEHGHPLDVTYGRFATVGGGSEDPGAELPASGAPSYLGAFKCLEVAPTADGWRGIGGDSWTCLVEFTPTGPQAQAVLIPGGPTEAGAPRGVPQFASWQRDALFPLAPLPSIPPSPRASSRDQGPRTESTAS